MNFSIFNQAISEIGAFSVTDALTIVMLAVLEWLLRGRTAASCCI